MVDIRRQKYAEILLVVALALLAVVARSAGWHEKTNDMVIFYRWYAELATAPGHGLAKEVGNYNAPFVYLLVVASKLPGALIYKLKAVFVLFDVLLALFVYLLVSLRWPGRRIATAAALLTVLLPTVVINASYWGQIDAMWAAPALGGVYFLLRDKPWWGVGLFGFAIAMKPQGIFIFPLLLLLLLAGRLPARTLLAAPAVYLALALPAVLSGRNPIELLTIYAMDRQAGNVNGLTLRAPSLYAFVPASSHDETVKLIAYCLTAAVVLGICWVLIARQVELTGVRVVTAAAFFALTMPFLLPGMHERYFFLADVLTVVLAVYRPRLWFVPLLVQAGSLLTYEGYLLDRLQLGVMIPAALMLAAVIVVGRVVIEDALRNDVLLEDMPNLATISPPAARPAPLPARPA